MRSRVLGGIALLISGLLGYVLGGSIEDPAVGPRPTPVPETPTRGVDAGNAAVESARTRLGRDDGGSTAAMPAPGVTSGRIEGDPESDIAPGDALRRGSGGNSIVRTSAWKSALTAESSSVPARVRGPEARVRAFNIERAGLERWFDARATVGSASPWDASRFQLVSLLNDGPGVALSGSDFSIAASPETSLGQYERAGDVRVTTGASREALLRELADFELARQQLLVSIVRRLDHLTDAGVGKFETGGYMFRDGALLTFTGDETSELAELREELESYDEVLEADVRSFVDGRPR